MPQTSEIRLPAGTALTQVQAALGKMIQDHEILIFMKGSAMLPQCGFSAQVVEIFKRLDKDFTTCNVLENELVRDGIKTFSNWPTLPQIFYKQKFLGGCDIVTAMYQNGELEALLQA